VWAPRCRSLDVVLEGRAPLQMSEADDGLFETTIPRVGAGARYQYRLDGGRHRPDPVSRWQPDGVHGPSAVVDPSVFAWTDTGFRGHALADLAFYELHVGTFTPAGTFEAIFDALANMSETAHLVQMFDSTVVRAHVSAAGAKGGKTIRRSAARAAASRRKSTSRSISAACRSRFI